MAEQKKYISPDDLLYYHTGLKDIFATKSALNATDGNVSALAGRVTTNEGDISQLKADVADRYTKTEVDTKLNDYYKKTETYSSTEVDTKLGGYYTKSETYTKTETDNAIADAVGDITGIDFQVVSSLPATGVKGTIYLLSNSGSGQNIYDEYIFVNNKWEKIGTTETDLSDYIKYTDLVEATETEIDTILAS